MNQYISWVTSVDWLELIRSLAPVATAVVAFAALKNWQRQDKAKRQAEFLDEVVEATNTYVFEIQKPVTMLQMAKIGMRSHVESWGAGDEQVKAVAGAIAYIQKRGEEDGAKLQTLLDEVEPSAVKLRSLGSKGQVFKFADYKQCQDAVTLLTWHFDRMTGFAAMIRSPSWNWKNPEVHSLLVKMMALEADDIRKSVSENNVAVLGFAQTTYGRIYG